MVSTEPVWQWSGSSSAQLEQFRQLDPGGAAHGAGVQVLFGLAGTVQTTVNLDAGETVGVISFTGSAGKSMTVSGANTLTLNNVSSNAAIFVSGTQSLAVPTVLSSNTQVTVTSSSDLFTWSGSVSGSGGLTKNGAGTQILSGLNSYTGPTTVSAGVLQLGNPSAAVNSTVSVNVNGGLTFSAGLGSAQLGGLAGSGNLALQDIAATPAAVNLTVGGNGASTVFGGNLSGSGGLTKTGLGSLTLTGSSNYSGPTNLAAGTLIVANTAGSATGAGTVTLNGGSLHSGSSGTIGGAVVAGSGPQTVAPGGALSPGQYGTLTLASLTTNSNTTLYFGLGSPLSGGSYTGDMLNFSTTAGLTAGLNTTINFSTPGAYGDFRLISGSFGTPNLNNLQIALQPPQGARYYLTTTDDPGYIDLGYAALVTGNWLGTSGSGGANWGLAANWNPQTVPNWPGTPVVFGGVGTYSTTAVLTAPETVGQVTLTGSAGYSMAISGTGLLTLNNAGLAPTINVTGTQSITAPVSLAATALVTVTSSSDLLTLSGNVSGTGGLTKSGAGTQVLGGSNTYSGPTTVSAGVLQLGSTNAAINSTLGVNVNGGLTFSAGLGSARLGGLAGSGNLALQDLAASPAAVNLTVGGNGSSNVYSGNLSGLGGLVKIGGGSLTLSGSNTYGGPTTLVAGTLVAANATGSATGQGNVTLNGGVLSSGSFGTIAGAVLAGSAAHVIMPGGGLPAGQYGTLTIGSLTTSSNTTLTFGLGSPVSGGSYTGDILDISSSNGLTVNPGTNISFSNSPATAGDYRLIEGALASANLNYFQLPAGYGTSYALSNSVDPGYIDLVVTKVTSQWVGSSSAGGSDWARRGIGSRRVFPAARACRSTSAAAAPCRRPSTSIPPSLPAR